jgi:dihydrofolate synthase/folylpolyglutamate synthase
MPTATPSKPSRKSKSASTSDKSSGSKRKSPRKSTASGVDGEITNYASALKWLYSHVDYERMRVVPYNSRTFSLDRMRKLLGYLGNPHEQLKCVQVAGTKGKGSTCAMVASMLEACGYTVGLYASPHLVDLRERITIGGDMISHADLIELFKQIAANESKFGEPRLSFFEIMTAAAMKYYADQAVDIVVLETGLGGRLDCTNVVDSLVCGITQISIDHTNILGKLITDIAREKAGIFKKGVDAVSVAQEPEVEAVLCEVAEAQQTPLQFTGKEIEFSYRFEANRELGPHSRVCITTPASRFEHLPVPLKGEHQALNCGLALSIIDRLKNHGFHLPEEKIIEGLAQTTIDGRMEQVHEQPRVIIDGAHNAASIHALVRALGAHVAYDSLVMIFGCGQDKDVNGMLKQIALGADKVIFTRARSNPRAMEPEDLLTRFNEITGKMAQTAPSLEQALRVAGRAVSREDLIIVTGSFYLVGEAKKYFDDAHAKQRAKQR